MARLLVFLIGVAAFAQQNQYVLVPSSAGNTGRLIFRERAANGTNEVRLKAPDNIAANVDFTMPDADGAANFSIATDGSGILSFKEMVSAFSHPGVQTILSDKYFASGLRTLDFELRDSAAGPISMQGYVTGWGSGALEAFSSGGILTVSIMSESGGSGGPGVIELFHPSTGLETLTFDSRGWLEMSHITTPSAAGGGRNRLYFKSTGELCSINNTGTEVCYGAGTGTPSLEMPVDFTVSGVTRARMWNASGNVSLYLNNSSGFAGVNFSNFVGGSEVRLVDTNGESNAMLRTGGSNGATLDLYADNSTSRTGVLVEGGQFTTGGSIKTFSLSSALVNRLDDAGLLTTTADVRSLKLTGATSGVFTLTIPAVTATYSVSWPGSAGTTGQCQVLSSPSVLAWDTCILGNASIQSKIGRLDLNGGLTFATYGQMYAGTASVPTIDFKSPTSGNTTVFIAGGNSAVESSILLSRNSGAVGLALTVNPSTGAGLVQFGSFGAEIATTGTDVTIRQTGDSIGQSYIKVQNRAGAGGGIVHADGVNVVDWKLESTSARQIRMEGRPGSLVCGYGDAELLFGDPGVALAFGVSTNGACVTGSRPMRFMGSSTGYAGLRAPATVSPYTWTLPPADSAGCLNSNGAGTLSILPCGSNELPISWTVTGVERARLSSTLGNARLDLKNSTGLFGVTLGNFTSGAKLDLFDTNGFSQATINTASGGDGATISLSQQDTNRLGVYIQGGPFSGDTGSITLIDYLSNTRAILKDRLTIYISGVGTPSVDLGLNGSAGGRLIMRDGFGFTRVVADQSGYSYFGSTPQSFTVNISCGAGTGTLTISGSIVTGKSGAC